MREISEVANGIYLIATRRSLVSVSAGLPTSSLIYYIRRSSARPCRNWASRQIAELIDVFRQIGDPFGISYAILTRVTSTTQAELVH